MTPPGVEIRKLSPNDASTDFERIFDVWCAASGLEPHAGVARGWRDHGWPTQRGYPDLRFVAAYRGQALIGFAYGYGGSPGQWWTDRIAEALSADVAAEWLGGHFELSEIAVAPASAHQGVGGSLHDALLAENSGRLAVLCTELGATPARRLFDRRGWVELGRLGAGFAVLGRRAEPPATSRTASD